VLRKSAFLLVVSGLALVLVGFRPFTPVKNVCPTCKVTNFDQVVLLNGAKVRCNVVAQNDDHYVVELFGEYRAVKKSEVSSVEWKNKAPRKLPLGDQVILKTGLVLHGTIADEQTGRYFTVTVGTLKHVVWVSQIDSVYKNGKKYTFATTPPKAKKKKRRRRRRTR